MTTFRILGQIEVYAGDRRVPLAGPRQVALLAVLLLHANRAVSVDRLIDAVWGAEQPAGAVKRLQVGVTRLRKVLAMGRVESSLRTVAGGYLLAVAAGELDADVFRARREEGHRALDSGDARRAAQLLRDALALWHGPPLAEVAFEEFAQAEIALLKELHLDTVESRVEADLGLGRHTELVGELEALIAANPTRERLAGQHMLALYRAGRQADALDAFHRMRVRLREDLGLDPGPALRALQAAILEQAAWLEPPAGAPAAAGPSASALAVLKPPAAVALPTFVGRAALLAGLRRACDSSFATRRGRVVALAGEPGIGKTRVAEELAAYAHECRATVLWSRCAEDSGAPAFWPWLQPVRELLEAVEATAIPGDVLEELRRLLGTPAPEPAGEVSEDPDEARFRRFDAVAMALRRATVERPAVLIFDDLQWADRSSLALLAHVSHALRGARALVVVTYRDTGPERRRALVDTLAELARDPAFERHELHGLEERDIAGYIEATAGMVPDAALVAALGDRTAGNPFFVGELVRMLPRDGLPLALSVLDALPGGVRDVVGRRLGQLSPRGSDILTIAAVAGQEFPVGLVARAAGVPRPQAWEALEEAVTARLLREDPRDPERLRFAHAIVRDGVIEELPRARRARLHGALGEALEWRQRRGQHVELAELAHHFVEWARGGGDATAALRYSLEAARHAEGMLAHAEAAEHYERALEALEFADEQATEQRGELLLALARAHTQAGDIEQGRRTYVEAERWARAAGSAQALARAALGHAEWRDYGVVDQEAIDALEGALVALPERDTPLRAAALGRLALRLDPAAQPRRERLLEEAHAMARRLNDDDTLSTLLAITPMVLWRTEQASARWAAASESIERSTGGGNSQAALWAHIVRFVDAMTAGQVTQADAELRAYGGLADTLRRPYYHWYGMVLQATRAIFAGRLDAGARLSREAVTLNRAHEPDADQEFVVQTLMLAKARGRPQDADAAALHRYASQYAALPLWRALAANCEWELGNEEPARRLYETCAADGFAAVADAPDRLGTLGLLCEVAAGLGDADGAVLLSEWLAPHADRNLLTERGWAAWGAIARHLGLLAATLGRQRAAERHFERALALHRAWGARPWLLRTIRDYLATAAAGPQRGALLAEAARLARELDVEPSLPSPGGSRDTGTAGLGPLS